MLIPFGTLLLAAAVYGRPDYATSGILVLAKTKAAARRICGAFARRACRKKYLAVVMGHVDSNIWDTRRVEFNVAEDPNCGQRMLVVSKDNQDQKDSHGCSRNSDVGLKGKNAITKISVLQHGFASMYRREASNVSVDPTVMSGATPQAKNNNNHCFQLPVTKLLLEPVTGRRHQLRLLCAQIMHHPIVGDHTYVHQWYEHYRLCLHAWELAMPTGVLELNHRHDTSSHEYTTNGIWTDETGTTVVTTSDPFLFFVRPSIEHDEPGPVPIRPNS